MTNKALKIMLSATLFCALSPSLFAQRPTTATHVSRADIMTVFEHMGETIDQQIKVVDIGAPRTAAATAPIPAKA